MKKSIRTLVVVLAAFSTFLFIYPDDLWEYDTAYALNTTLRGSSEKFATHRGLRAIYSSPFTTLGRRTHSRNYQAQVASPMLVSLASCVLLC